MSVWNWIYSLVVPLPAVNVREVWVDDTEPSNDLSSMNVDGLSVTRHIRVGTLGPCRVSKIALVTEWTNANLYKRINI